MLGEGCGDKGDSELRDGRGENGGLGSLVGRGRGETGDLEDLAQSGTGAGPLVKPPNKSANQSMIGLRNRDPV